MSIAPAPNNMEVGASAGAHAPDNMEEGTSAGAPAPHPDNMEEGTPALPLPPTIAPHHYPRQYS